MPFLKEMLTFWYCSLFFGDEELTSPAAKNLFSTSPIICKEKHFLIIFLGKISKPERSLMKAYVPITQLWQLSAYGNSCNIYILHAFYPLLNYFNTNPRVLLKDIFFREKETYNSLPQVLPLLANWLLSLLLHFPNAERAIWYYHLAPSLACFQEPYPSGVDPCCSEAWKWSFSVTMDRLVLLGRLLPCSGTFNLLMAICPNHALSMYLGYFQDAPSTQNQVRPPVILLAHFTLCLWWSEWNKVKYLSILIAWVLHEGR